MNYAEHPVNDKSQGVPMEAFDWLTCQTKKGRAFQSQNFAKGINHVDN